MINLNYDPHNRKHRTIRAVIIAACSIVIFILAWNDISLFLNKAAVPSPMATFQALIKLFTEGDVMTGFTMWHHIWVSLQRFLMGLIIAFAISVVLGLLIGSSKTLNEFSKPVIEILRPIAPMAWAPIFLFTMGYTWGPVAVVFIGILFPLMTNTIFGVNKIDPKLVDAAKTLGASKLQIFYKVLAPSTVPHIMNGLFVGSGIGWMCIVASELYAGSGGGIGYFIGIQSSCGFWPNVYAGLVVIAALGLLTTGVFGLVYKVVSRRMGME